MLVVMNQNSSEEQIKAVEGRIKQMGLKSLRVPGSNRISVCVLGNQGEVDRSSFSGLSGIRDLISVTKPYKLVSREVKQEKTQIALGSLEIGGSVLATIAGPCSLEDHDITLRMAHRVKELGAALFRAMIFKPRTSPYSFQGKGLEALSILKAIRQEVGLPVVTEIMSHSDIESLYDHVDVFQIGARNMQNFSLLKEIGQQSKPVLLKRGMSATLEEFLMTAEYILSAGNSQVILCERGIRTFSQHSRNTFDLSIVPRLQELTHLPIVVDPSHATGMRTSVPSMALAGVAAGADGLMIEVHENPENALSDGQQTVDFQTFESILEKGKRIRELLEPDRNTFVAGDSQAE